ncbi:hypothetical protein VOI32_15555, partial [Paraburkholderia caribensis]
SLHRPFDPFVGQMLSQPAEVGRLLRIEQEGQVTGEHRAEKLTGRRLVYNIFPEQKQKCRSVPN